MRKSARKRRLGRPRRRWEDNIKMDLKNKMEERALDQFTSREGQVAVCCQHSN